MPSPVGHALGGIAVGYAVLGERRRRLIAGCAVLAALPDVDFLLPLPHRGPTHSITASLVVCAVTLVAGRLAAVRTDRLRIAAAASLAVLSHVLLDWLGQDSRTPRGLMALWPLTSDYYISDVNLFYAVDRRVSRPGFYERNAIAVLWELVILLPVAFLAWRSGRRQSKA
jgi:membrane-bound metal-dependent hydrolase YbcI (DUF457 family)